MPAEGDELRLLLKVAKLFYLQNLTKTEISHEIRVSTTQVARLLQRAHDLGIVKIEFVPPLLEELAERVRGKYPNLIDVRVVPYEEDHDFQMSLLANATAAYFENNVQEGARVGLSGGSHVFNMVNALPNRARNMQLFPSAILARGGAIVRHIDPIVSLMLLWAKNGNRKGGVSFVTITPLEGRLELAQVQRHNRKLLEESTVVRTLYEDMKRLDFVFASVGGTLGSGPKGPQEAAFAIDLLADVGITEKDLLDQGAIADMNYCFIDEAGEGRREWEGLFLTPGVDHLRSMAADANKRVVVTAGRKKEVAIRAALKGGLLNVLITDEQMARHLGA